VAEGPWYFSTYILMVARKPSGLWTISQQLFLFFSSLNGWILCYAYHIESNKMFWNKGNNVSIDLFLAVGIHEQDVSCLVIAIE
jgi:hypothetical protein